jgi:hypothetical protein
MVGNPTAGISTAPKQVNMQAAGDFGFLAPHNALLVKQTMRGCLQECMGCEAKSEYKVSEMDYHYINSAGFINDGTMSMPDFMYLLEESSFIARCCLQEGRAFSMPVTSGAEAGGHELMRFDKPMGCQICLNIPIPYQEDGGVGVFWVDCPMCCMLPQLETKKPGSNQVFSKTQYVCDMFLAVPKFDYYEDGQVVYRIIPETCCGGCCLMPRCCRGGRTMFPFFFHDPTSGRMVGEEQPDLERPQITKVFAGLKKECCSTADNFAVFFPPGCDSRRKAGLLGATMLIDLAWFEGHD